MFCYGNDKMWCSSNAIDGLMVFCDVSREGHLFNACPLSADFSICSCLLWDEQKLSDALTDLTWADEAHGEPSPIAYPPANNTPCLPLSKFSIRHLHISHIICTLFAPLPPPHQIFHNFYFSFLRGITAVPREIKNNAYAKFCGVNKVHCGRCASGI